jgi:hypothetical protein
MTRVKICSHCGLNFLPNQYNKHHQTYCTSRECQKARKRENTRLWRKRTIASMTPSELERFRRQERLRVNKTRHRGRAAGKVGASPGVPSPQVLELVKLVDEVDLLSRVVVGLAVQLSGVSESSEVFPLISKYVEIGRLPCGLGRLMAGSRASPTPNLSSRASSPSSLDSRGPPPSA